MSLLYGLLWRFLLALVQAHRGLVSWLRVRLRCCKECVWPGARALLLLPLSFLGASEDPKRIQQSPDRSRVEKVPVHIGLLVTEEELSYTDIANVVVWCMALGMSYISVYDSCGEPCWKSAH